MRKVIISISCQKYYITINNKYIMIILTLIIIITVIIIHITHIIMIIIIITIIKHNNDNDNQEINAHISDLQLLDLDAPAVCS